MEERLTVRFSNGQAAVKGCGDNCKYNFKYCKEYEENCPTISEILEKLAKYEELEEKESLFELPCESGQELFGIYDEKIIYGYCDGYLISKPSDDDITYKYIWFQDMNSENYWRVPFEDFGVNIFYTEEEAIMNLNSI